MSDTQSLHLYIDKIRGLFKFVARPRPVLVPFRGAMQIVQERVLEGVKPLVGKFVTPQAIDETISIAKNAIQHAHSVTGQEIQFSHSEVMPAEWDDLKFLEGT